MRDCIHRHPSTVALLVVLAAMAVSSASAQMEQDSLDKEWLGFVEIGLGIGRMDHTVDGMQEELFGVDVLRKGGEQDAFGFRAGIGRELGGDIVTVLYGGYTALTP